MTDLDIDTDQLKSISQNIRSVVDALHNAKQDASEAAEYVGHDRLAGKVREFGDAWRIHREDTISEITALADLFDAVHQTFADLEGNTAAQLRTATDQARAGVATPTSAARGIVV